MAYKDKKKSTTPKKKVTVKDQHDDHLDYYSTLSDDLKGFLDEVYLLDDGKFKGIRLTSGKRGGNEHSHHTHGDAVDIAAWRDGGELGNELYSRLLNTPDGLALLNKYKLGIYDETDPTNMQKTGASGPHFHIGKDTGLFSNTANRLGQFASGDTPALTSFYSQHPDFDYNNIEESYASVAAGGAAGIGTHTGAPAPFDIMSGDPNSARTFVQEIEREAEKEEETDRRITESDARRRIEEAKALKFEAEMAKKKAFLKTIADITAPEAPRERGRQKPFREEKFNPIEMQTALPNLPSIHQLPKEFQDGGITTVDGVDPTEPETLTPKQKKQQQYFTILDNLRKNYQHLDQDSHQWEDRSTLNFGGDKVVKNFDEKSFTPVTTSDYITWRVSGISFKPDPTSFIDMGISGLKREDFETDEAYQTAYDADRVVLAPREHPKYGNMYVPIGTGKKSQKLAESFGKEFGRFYNKGKQIIPYYSVTDEDTYAQPYYDWRQQQLEEFASGVQEQKYGGIFNYNHGGPHKETAIVDSEGTITNRFKKIPLSVDYQQTGPESATWQLPGPYASPERKSEEQFARDTFNQTGTVAKPYTLEFEEAIVYGRPESKKKQERLLNQYTDNYRKLYQYEQHQGVSLPASNRIEDLEKWNKEVGVKLKEIDAGVKQTRTRVEAIQKKLGYDNPQDVLSFQGYDDFRKMYKEGKIDRSTFMDAYKNVLKPYDPNNVTLSEEDQKLLYYGWHGINPETGKKTWIMDPVNTAKVAKVVTVAAPLAPAALMLAPEIGAGMALMDKPITMLGGFSAAEITAPYYTYKTVESGVDFVKDPSLENAGMFAFNATGVPRLFSGAKTAPLWREYGAALRNTQGQRLYSGLFSSSPTSYNKILDKLFNKSTLSQQNKGLFK